MATFEFVHRKSRNGGSGRQPKGMKRMLETFFGDSGIIGHFEIHEGFQISTSAERRGLRGITVANNSQKPGSFKLTARPGSGDTAREYLVYCKGDGLTPTQVVKALKTHLKSLRKKKDTKASKKPANRIPAAEFDMALEALFDFVPSRDAGWNAAEMVSGSEYFAQHGAAASGNFIAEVRKFTPPPVVKKGSTYFLTREGIVKWEARQLLTATAAPPQARAKSSVTQPVAQKKASKSKSVPTPKGEGIQITTGSSSELTGVWYTRFCQVLILSGGKNIGINDLPLKGLEPKHCYGVELRASADGYIRTTGLFDEKQWVLLPPALELYHSLVKPEDPAPLPEMKGPVAPSAPVGPLVEDKDLVIRANAFARNELGLSKQRRILQFLWFVHFGTADGSPTDFIEKFGLCGYKNKGSLEATLVRTSNLNTSGIKKGSTPNTYRYSALDSKWVDGRDELLQIDRSLDRDNLNLQRLALEVKTYVDQTRHDVSDAELPFLLAYGVFGSEEFTLTQFVELFGLLTWRNFESLRTRFAKASKKDALPVVRHRHESGSTYSIPVAPEFYMEVRTDVLAATGTGMASEPIRIPEPVNAAPIKPEGIDSSEDRQPAVPEEDVDYGLRALQIIGNALEHGFDHVSATEAMSLLDDSLGLGSEEQGVLCLGLKDDGLFVCEGPSSVAIIQLTPKGWEAIGLPERAEEARLGKAIVAPVETKVSQDPNPPETLEEVDERLAQHESALIEMIERGNATLARVRAERASLAETLEEERKQAALKAEKLAALKAELEGLSEGERAELLGEFA